MHARIPRTRFAHSAMNELGAFQSFWILAGNTLLHELGLPLPVMPTAFVLAARGISGAGDLLLLIAAIVAGMLIGNSVWFAAGRRYGAGVLKFLCRFSLTADTCVSRTERVFGRWGWSSLVVGRFVPGVSLVAPPLAGALGMTWVKFLALATAGAALYGLVVLGTGILLRNQIDWVLRELQSLGWQTFAAVIVTLAMYIAWRWWHRRVARAPDVSRISVHELQALIAAGERPLVVDVRGRTTQQIDLRRIPDAIAISLDAIEASRDDLPRDRKIVVYCGCPNEASAAAAARLLLDRGYPWVRPLFGGLEAWSTAPNTRDTVASPPSDAESGS
jgi:membrane protein DedA with SNARE-associated domain/rhodanese-related sulfurtransferase